ncbi:MAG: NTPase [Streptococcus salivarius]|nr:NTPase [Streptococcus salivarius]
MEHEFIKLEHIDTSVAAKNFADLLYDNKTYFLNGSWGSGKSEFLKEVKRGSQNKLITIDFWRLTDTRSTIEIAFSKLHPLLYWAIRLGVVLLVAVSILMTNVVDIGLGNYFGGSKPLILKLGGVVALIVALWQVFKKKSDEFYCFLLSKLPKFSKVLIIDDFDRMSEKQQEESYKLFSLINGKLPIVFVGDITKVHKNDDNYLSKIIDRQVELPFDLHPSNIWEGYFRKLTKALDFRDDDGLETLFFNKNLRDMQKFNDYVNQEFFVRGKKDRVRPEQQLAIIYLFLFEYDMYKMQISTDNRILRNKFQNDPYKLGTVRIIEKILFDNSYDWTPFTFRFNRGSYILFEATSNHLEQDLKALLDGNGSELKLAVLHSTRYSDFYQYISHHLGDIDASRKQKLFEIAINLSINHSYSETIDMIIKEKNTEIVRDQVRRNKSEEDLIIYIIKEWKDFLSSYVTDPSEVLLILVKHDILSFTELGIVFNKLNELFKTNKNFTTLKEFKRPEILFIIYLSSIEKYNTFERWDDLIWTVINNFNDSQFIIFWKIQNVLSIHGFDDNISIFDYRLEKRNYILRTGKFFAESSDKIDKSQQSIISKIKPRLEKMKKEGFVFTEEE